MNRDRNPIRLYIPDMWVRMDNLPGISTFYKNLLEILEDSGEEFEAIHVKGVRGKKKLDNPNPGYTHITHHTNDVRDNVINVKLAYLPDYFYMDRYGYAGRSRMANDASLYAESQQIDIDKAEEFYRGLQRMYVNGSRTKYFQRDKEFTPPEGYRSYTFFPTQVLSDVVSRYARIDVQGVLEWLKGYRGSDHFFIIKRHPYCRSVSIRETLSEMGTYGNFAVVNRNIHSIISHVDRVLTVNSGVGFEALLHGVPVFTTGKSDYEWVTYNIDSRESLSDIFKSVTVNTGERMKFLYYFLNKYNVRVDSKERIKERLRRLAYEK